MAKPEDTPAATPPDAWAPFLRSGVGPVAASAAAFVLLVGLPLAALLARALSDGMVGQYLGDRRVVAALRLSLLTTAATLALAILAGTPMAYVLARRDSPGKQLRDKPIYQSCCRPPSLARRS